MSAESQYTSELSRGFGGYFAAWTPGVPLTLGDFGIVEGKSFRRLGHLADLSLGFNVCQDVTPETIGPYKSAGKVSVSFKAAGAAPLAGSQLAEADAGFFVEFASEHGVFFVAEHCFQPSIGDQAKLGKEILAAYKAGDWNKDWRVITQLVEAKSMTVLISSSKGGSVDLKAAGNISTAITDGTLAKVDLGWVLHSARQMETTLVASAGATPLFRLSGMRKRFFRKPTFDGFLTRIIGDANALALLPLQAITPNLVRQHPQLEEELAFDDVVE